jgi:DNA polymerase elongation subunit (family B)
MNVLCCYKPQWVLWLLLNRPLLTNAHRRGFVPNRPKRDEEATTVPQVRMLLILKKAFKTGLAHLDINSLYPSAIRALNMGPETIVGQLRQTMTQEYIDDQ